MLEVGSLSTNNRKTKELRENTRRVFQLKDDIAECFKLRMESSVFFSNFDIVFFSFSYIIFIQVPNSFIYTLYFRIFAKSLKQKANNGPINISAEAKKSNSVIQSQSPFAMQRTIVCFL